MEDNKEFLKDNILWTNVAKISSFSKKKQQVFNVNRNEILVLKTNGIFKAIHNRCPHAGLSMNGSEVDSKEDLIICKWHKTSFCYKSGDVKKWVDVSLFEKKIANFLARFSKKIKQMVEMKPTSIQVFDVKEIQEDIWVGIEVEN